MFFRIKQQKTFFLLLLCVIGLFLLSLFSALHESLTFDEVVYFQEGRNIIQSQSFSIDPYNPPLTAEISIFPYIFTKAFYKDSLFALNHPLPGRVMIILLSCFLVLSIFFITKRVYGVKSAFFALFLAILEPSILAYSHYNTIDIAVSLWYLLAYLVFLHSVEQTSKKGLFLLGALIGCGMATKISFIPYFLSATILVGIYRNISTKVSFRKNIVKNFFVLMAVIVVTLLTIWATYLFQWSVVIKAGQGGTNRVSQKVLVYAKQRHNTFLKKAILFGENVKIPLGDYFAIVKNNALREAESGQCFFFGKYFHSCSWYFMPLTLLLKIPIPLFLFLGLSCLIFLRQKKKEKSFMYFLIPIICILGSSMILKMTPLVRYDLPLYPFLIILAASTFSFWTKNIKRKICLCLLFLWYAYTTLASFPHTISYANELSWGQKPFLLTDSNIDWGQSLPDVAVYHTNNLQTAISLSYFGRANGDLYGLQSDKAYGSYKNNEICAFHTIESEKNTRKITFISISNWHACGYSLQARYRKSKIKGILSDSFFIF